MLLADEAPFFHEIVLGRPQLAHVADRKGVAWFWALQIACTICGIFVLWLMNKLRLSTFKDAIFRSSIPLFHGILCLLCGMYTILACVIWYVSYGKKHGSVPENFEPYSHYLQNGYLETVKPSAHFRVHRYFDLFPYIRLYGICPVVHYELLGKYLGL